MNILVCGGKVEADYVLRAFKKQGNNIVIMNEDDDTVEMLSEHYDLDVLKIDPTKIYSFETADVTNFDLVVSLMEKDADNFVVCKIAKELFHIKKAICTVTNPNNVSIFQRLGIDSPISASYLLTEKIKGESDVESIFRTLSLEDEKIVITEVKVLDSFPCVGQTLAQLRLPDTGNITCIFRDPDVIIPRGNTTILAGDTMVIASAIEAQQELIDYIKFGPDEELKKERQIQAEAQKKEAEEAAALAAADHEKEIQQAVDMALDKAKEEFQQQKESELTQLKTELEQEKKDAVDTAVNDLKAEYEKEKEEQAQKAAEEAAKEEAEKKPVEVKVEPQEEKPAGEPAKTAPVEEEGVQEPVKETKTSTRRTVRKKP